jgi:hypothetical protein
MNSPVHLLIVLLLVGSLPAIPLPAWAEAEIEFEETSSGGTAVKGTEVEKTPIEGTRVEETKVEGSGFAGSSAPATETEGTEVKAGDRHKSEDQHTGSDQPETGENGATEAQAQKSAARGDEPSGNEVKGRYVTVESISRDLLKEFNEELYLGRRLGYLIKNKDIVTVEDEVRAKLDAIMEKVEVTLDMFPPDLHITLVLLPSADDVSEVYQRNYGKKVNHIAYYSLSEDTIYVSVEDTRLEVIAHEMGHAIVDHYFTERPPYTIHELMAQFAEKHIAD